MKKKILCFDLDNVICTTKKNYYSLSKPKKKVIKLINFLYENGYYIKIFTARGMGQFKRDKKKINKNIKGLTLLQLKKWKVQYHELILFKPSYDIFVDDKSLSFNSNWISHLIKELKIKNI